MHQSRSLALLECRRAGILLRAACGALAQVLCSKGGPMSKKWFCALFLCCCTYAFAEQVTLKNVSVRANTRLTDLVRSHRDFRT